MVHLCLIQYGFDNIKIGGLHTEVRSSPPALKVLCMPMCYIMIATFAMLGKRIKVTKTMKLMRLTLKTNIWSSVMSFVPFRISSSDNLLNKLRFVALKHIKSVDKAPQTVGNLWSTSV